MKIVKKGIVKNPIKKENILSYIEDNIKKLALEWENNVKMIISDGALDTGEFVNSIWSEVIVNNDKISFIGHDGVNYGIFHEKGTKLHWVPFYYYGDTSKPVLADWAHRVLGMSEEEMLAQGGMNVKIDKLEPFIKSLLLIQNEAPEIFKNAQIKFMKEIKK